MKRDFRVLLAAVPLFFVAGAQALAADEHADPVGAHAAAASQVAEEHGAPVAHDAAAEGGHEAAPGEHHSSGGLPQLNPSTWPSQIFWLFLTFFTLYMVFSRRVLPELSSTIENRRNHIQGDIDAAQQNKEKADDVHKAYEEILDDARRQATGFYADVENDIRVKTAKKLEELRDRSAKETQDMEKKIEQAKKEAMEDMGTIAAEIASKAAEKIVGIPTDLNQAKTVVQNLKKKAA